jgi:phage/plasmid-like protein (TIGR03299 family)
MAHEVDTKADGTGAMFSVGETPWHQGETNSLVLAQAPRTAKEALIAGGLDWEVDLRPAHYEVGNGDYMEVAGAKILVRRDRNTALGVVGSIYRPLQNIRALETLQPLVDQGLATWETAGSLQGGRRIWALVKYNIESKKVRTVYGKELVPFGTIFNTHDGRTLVTLAETIIRIVCRNTQLAAEHDVAGRANTQRIRHDGQVESNTARAAELLWADIVQRHEALAAQIALLKRTRLDIESFNRIVLDRAVPTPVPGKDNALAHALMKTRLEKAQAKRETLVKLWTQGEGHEADHSAWHAFNALTQATDHADQGVFTSAGKLGAILPGGGLQTIKLGVWTDLLAFAEERNHVVTLSA